MKALLTLIVILSIAVNIGFLTGCATFHDAIYGTPCKFSDGGKAELVRIANCLGIKTSGKEASDISGDIRYVLDRSAHVPASLSDTELAKVKNQLSSVQGGTVEEINKFVDSLQGKRVIVIAPEE